MDNMRDTVAVISISILCFLQASFLLMLKFHSTIFISILGILLSSPFAGVAVLREACMSAAKVQTE